jgi:hypothetical protein
MDPAQTGQIQQAISEGEYYGMQTFDQALLKLVEEDGADYEEALKASSRPQDVKLMVQSLGLGVPHRQEELRVGAARAVCAAVASGQAWLPHTSRSQPRLETASLPAKYAHVAYTGEPVTRS